MKLDTTDLKILRLLQADGSLSNLELAKKINLSPSPTLARVKRLEESGVIAHYAALVNPAALGLQLTVFISISLEKQEASILDHFEAKISQLEEVMEAYLMTGDEDYLLRLAVRDIHALERFILDNLTLIPGVGKIRSSFALKRVKYTTALPIHQT